MIQLTDLQFSYQQQPVLSIADWQVKRGEQLLLCGDSGSGKSTLLHLLAGLNQPDSGQVCIAGEELTQMSGRRKDRFRAKHIGFISQRLNLISVLIRDRQRAVGCQTERHQNLTFRTGQTSSGAATASEPWCGASSAKSRKPEYRSTTASRHRTRHDSPAGIDFWLTSQRPHSISATAIYLWINCTQCVANNKQRW